MLGTFADYLNETELLKKIKKPKTKKWSGLCCFSFGIPQ